MNVILFRNSKRGYWTFQQYDHGWIDLKNRYQKHELIDEVMTEVMGLNIFWKSNIDYDQKKHAATESLLRVFRSVF